MLIDFITQYVTTEIRHNSIQSISNLLWAHDNDVIMNERYGVSNHQPHDCLLHCLYRHRSKKTSKLRVSGLCAGNRWIPHTKGQQLWCALHVYHDDMCNTGLIATFLKYQGRQSIISLWYGHVRSKCGIRRFVQNWYRFQMELNNMIPQIDISKHRVTHIYFTISYILIKNYIYNPVRDMPRGEHI